MYQIFVLNLGTTSTKVAVYRDKECLADNIIRHPMEVLHTWATSSDQIKGRVAYIQDWLDQIDCPVKDMSAIALRGCIFPGGTRSGTYLLTEALKENLLAPVAYDKPMNHATRIGLPVALTLLGGYEIPIYITDPPCVDELKDVARLSGFAQVARRSVFHALNSKAVAYQVAERLNKPYCACNFIVAHLGGGISIAAHEQGRVVEVNNCFGGEGPFSTDRAGSIPGEGLIDICYAGTSKEECLRMVKGSTGGVMSYLGTSDMQEVERRIEAGDTQADMVFQAMAYQISKEIGSCYAAMRGSLDTVIITGGIAYSRKMVSAIRDYIGSFASVTVVPGEFENEALAYGALRVLEHKEEPIII